MGTTLYIQRAVALHKRFCEVQVLFHKVMKDHLRDVHFGRANWEDPMGHIRQCFDSPNWHRNDFEKYEDDFEGYVKELKALKEELQELRHQIHNRSSFFKHGNIKQKIDEIINVKSIDVFKATVKDSIRAMEKSWARERVGDNRSSEQHLVEYFDYLEEYEQQLSSGELKEIETEMIKQMKQWNPKALNFYMASSMKITDRKDDQSQSMHSP